LKLGRIHLDLLFGGGKVGSCGRDLRLRYQIFALRIVDLLLRH